MHGPIRSVIARIAAISLLGTLMLSLQTLHAQQANVLLRETFEGAFKNDPFCREGGCEVPEGWGVWFTPRAENDPPNVNERPVFDRWTIAPYEGNAAQRMRARYATFSGGLCASSQGPARHAHPLHGLGTRLVHKRRQPDLRAPLARGAGEHRH